MRCPRCYRFHSGVVCGIPRSPIQIGSGFGMGGIASMDIPGEKFSANLAQANKRLAEGKHLIEAKIEKLRGALDSVMSEIEAGADEPLSREEELLRQAIQRLMDGL